MDGIEYTFVYFFPYLLSTELPASYRNILSLYEKMALLTLLGIAYNVRHCKIYLPQLWHDFNLAT